MSHRKAEEMYCDRCGAEITGPPYMQLTIHYHHPRKLDICGKCEPSLVFWLSKVGLELSPIDQLLKGRISGWGIPNDAEVTIFQNAVAKLSSEEQKLLFGREF